MAEQEQIQQSESSSATALSTIEQPQPQPQPSSSSSFAPLEGDHPPPRTIVMSRGNSEGSSSGNGTENGNSNDNDSGSASGGLPPRRHCRDSKDQIVLTANHQQRLSGSRRTKATSSSRNNANPGTAPAAAQNHPGRPPSKDKTSSSNNNNSSSAAAAAAAGAGGGTSKLPLPPLVSGAWGWIQSQRDKAKQEKLNKMAREQIHVLKEAQRTDPSVNFTVLEDSPSLSGSGSNNSSRHNNNNNNNNSTATTSIAPSISQDEDEVSWIPPVRCVEEKSKNTTATAITTTTTPMGQPHTPSLTASSSSDHSPRNSTSTNTTTTTPTNTMTRPIPFILTPEQMHDIARYVLPKGIAFCRWKRLYSLTRDGDSFLQCLRLCGSEPKTLMVVKTTRGDVFGGYADAPWEENKRVIVGSSNSGFHGSAQACLYSFSIPEQQNELPGEYSINNPKTKVKPHTSIRVFHWTGANRYIQYTDTSESRRRLAFGGGGDQGTFGLCVEQDFQQGSTGPCDTFGNLPLCDQENFNILDLEIWGFLTGQF